MLQFITAETVFGSARYCSPTVLPTRTTEFFCCILQGDLALVKLKAPITNPAATVIDEGDFDEALPQSFTDWLVIEAMHINLPRARGLETPQNPATPMQSNSTPRPTLAVTELNHPDH